MLNAVGVPGWRIVGAVSSEGALVGLVGALIGIAAGFAASQIVVRKTVVMTSGWHFVYEFPVQTAILLGLLTVVVSAGVGLLPGRVALRRQFLLEEPAE